MEQHVDSNMRLRRYLSPLSAWAMSFGCAVGWGAFVIPSTEFLPLAGPVGTLIGLAAGAAVMFLVGRNYHYLIQHFPESGGAYAYAAKVFGADYGFLTAWSLSLAYMAILWANATALVLLVRYVFDDALQFGWHSTVAGFDVYFGEAMLSVGMIVLAGICCLCHRFLAGRLQMVCAIFMVVSIAVCFGIAAIRANPALAKMKVYLFTAEVEMLNTYGENGFDGILLEPVSLESLRRLVQ